MKMRRDGFARQALLGHVPDLGVAGAVIDLAAAEVFFGWFVHGHTFLKGTSSGTGGGGGGSRAVFAATSSISSSARSCGKIGVQSGSAISQRCTSAIAACS